MIPKRIINCWMGRGKKSPLFEECLASQARVSGWEVIEINEDSATPLMKLPYMKAVLARGEFVKATELGRLWGLENYGGVYMDADVELLRPMDHLLDTNFFIGREDEQHLNGAVMGSVPFGDVIQFLRYGFPHDSLGEKSAHYYGPTYLTQRLAHVTPSFFVEHPPEVFYPSHWRTPQLVIITDKTVAHHKWVGSWVAK